MYLGRGASRDTQARWGNDLKFIEFSKRKADTSPQKKKAINKQALIYCNDFH